MNIDSIPIVIVVTPTFNSERFLDETLRTVELQRGFFKIYFHVQDGCSSDETINILKRWEARFSNQVAREGADITFTWKSEPDNGMYDALNKGFLSVLERLGTDVVNKNPILTWINSDDIFIPNAFKTVVDFFEHNPNDVWVTGLGNIMGESGVLSDSWNIPTAFSQKSLAEGGYDGRRLPFVQQEGTFFRYSLWQKVGGIDTRYKLAGDWDLWRRFAACTELIKLRCPLAIHRRHSSQLSSEMVNYYNEIDGSQPVQIAHALNENGWFSICETGTKRWVKIQQLSKMLFKESSHFSPIQNVWDEVDFGHQVMPPWVESVSGLSSVEAFGRWSDANLAQSVRIVSTAVFPRTFKLKIVMRSIETTLFFGCPVKICVGAMCYTENISKDFKEICLDVVNTNGANSIDIYPSRFVSPLSRGWSQDGRLLGIAIQTLKVE